MWADKKMYDGVVLMTGTKDKCKSKMDFISVGVPELEKDKTMLANKKRKITDDSQSNPATSSKSQVSQSKSKSAKPTQNESIETDQIKQREKSSRNKKKTWSIGIPS